MDALYVVARRPQTTPTSTIATFGNITTSTQAGSSSSSIANPHKKPRRSFILVDECKLGKRALEFKESSGDDNRWLSRFITETFPGLDDNAAQREKKRIRRAIKLSQKPTLELTQTASRSSHVPNSLRRRQSGAGKGFYNHVIREELFQWFIDCIEHHKARIPSFILLAQAELIAQDYRDGIQLRIQEGELDPSFEYKIPKFTAAWLYLWRRCYHLSWRTVNLRFKVSYGKMKELLCIFWINILRIRWLHYFLCGCEQILQIVNCDEKPLHFTSAHDQKTLAPTCSPKVSVVENMPMSRARFTWKTITQFKNAAADAVMKKGACLFKGIEIDKLICVMSSSG